MQRLRSILISLALVTLATPVFSQTMESNRAGAPRVNLVSANPIGLLFQWYNAEFEHALNPTASLAVAGTRFGFDHFNYTAVDGIVRYYPSGRAIQGFSIGGSVGFVNASEDNCNRCDTGSGATVGVRGDYVWILGRDQRFAAAAGIGAKRIFVQNVGNTGLPIARLSIGWAW